MAPQVTQVHSQYIVSEGLTSFTTFPSLCFYFSPHWVSSSHTSSPLFLNTVSTVLLHGTELSICSAWTSHPQRSMCLTSFGFHSCLTFSMRPTLNTLFKSVSYTQPLQKSCLFYPLLLVFFTFITVSDTTDFLFIMFIIIRCFLMLKGSATSAGLCFLFVFI